MSERYRKFVITY